MNEKVFMDQYQKSFLDEEEFIAFLQEREENSAWQREKDSVKVFSQKQIWPFGSRQSTGYDIRQQIILCF